MAPSIDRCAKVPPLKRAAIYFLLVAFCAYGGTFIAAVISPQDWLPIHRWLLKCLIVMAGVIAVTNGFLRRDREQWREYGVSWSRRTVGLCLRGGIAGGLLVLAWAGAVTHWAPFEWQPNSQFSLTAWAAGAMAACAMGVAEEVGYRSYGMKILHRTLGPAAAVVIPSFIFTLAHIAGGMDWRAGVLVVGTCSVLYGSLMLVTRSLPVVAAFHIANNLFQDWLLRPSEASPWEPVYHQSGRSSDEAGLLIWASMAAINLGVAAIVIVGGSKKAALPVLQE